MNDQQPTAETLEAALGGRWGIWRSDTGRWWASRRGPLTAAGLTAGCVPFLRADTPDQLAERIKDQDALSARASGQPPQEKASPENASPAGITTRTEPSMPAQPPKVTSAPNATATQALNALASELTAHGWTASLHTPDGRRPSLYVQNPASARLSEHIYAGPAADGTWSYWWPWADTIAPTADPAGTAAAITWVLRAAVTQPEPAP